MKTYQCQAMLGRWAQRCACFDTRNFEAGKKASLSKNEVRDMYIHWCFSRVLESDCSTKNKWVVSAKNQFTTAWANGIFGQTVYRSTKELDHIRERGICNRAPFWQNGLLDLWISASLCFSKHSNTLYVFATSVLRPEFPRHVQSWVHRWVIHLIRFEFFINYIEGFINAFDDILARRLKGYRKTMAQRIAALIGDIVLAYEEIKTGS